MKNKIFIITLMGLVLALTCLILLPYPEPEMKGMRIIAEIDFDGTVEGFCEEYDGLCSVGDNITSIPTKRDGIPSMNLSYEKNYTCVRMGEYHIGDIVCFWDGEKDYFTCHRIVETDEKVWTRGDNFDMIREMRESEGLAATEDKPLEKNQILCKMIVG